MIKGFDIHRLLRNQAVHCKQCVADVHLQQRAAKRVVCLEDYEKFEVKAVDGSNSVKVYCKRHNVDIGEFELPQDPG